jgi:tetratricopeptide (TPR) repeat protein
MVLVTTLTCAPPDAFPSEKSPAKSHAQAVAGLTHADPSERAAAVAWLALHGAMADQPLLLQRLRDENPGVRLVAEQALWLVWSRSGDDAVDRLLASGTEQMQSGRLHEAIASFSEVIRRSPAFAEGWNKRATAYFLAGDFQRSLADCGEVVKRNPRHFGVLSGYGQIYFRLEEYDKAIAWWRRALEVNPNMDGVESNIEAARQLLEQRRRKMI